jgi:hypothetical protein
MSQYIAKTENSTYEVDAARSRIRRLHGTNPPTERLAPDGEWKTYEELRVYFSGGLLVVWPLDPTDQLSDCTVTSPIERLFRFGSVEAVQAAGEAVQQVFEVCEAA